MSEPTSTAPPIVLIHGLWMTARSWDRWVEHYKSAAHTDYKEFEGRSHFTVGQPGWEDVADYALSWCNEHSGRGLVSMA